MAGEFFSKKSFLVYFFVDNTIIKWYYRLSRMGTGKKEEGKTMTKKFSKEEQRRIILSKLAAFQKANTNFVFELHSFIRWAMGIEPVERRLSPYGYFYGTYPVYAETDEAKVKLVIKHLEEQGYIKIYTERISKKVVAEMFEVLRTK